MTEESRNSGQDKLRPTFVDLFSGCGGLSLGLLQGGWRALFALEREPNAFETYRFNLIDGEKGFAHEWPEWLSKESHDIRTVLATHEAELVALRGKVDLVAGGPPCQGFSFAGRRNADDPRNRLFKDYLRFVGVVQPKIVLVENVSGMGVRHGKKYEPWSRKLSYTERLKRGLRRAGYHVLEPVTVRASRFGVPQRRPRIFVVAIRRSGAHLEDLEPLNLLLERLRSGFLASKGLPYTRFITVSDAISDLRKSVGRLYDFVDAASPRGFKAGTLGMAESSYQRLMRGGRRCGNRVDSHRFANHREQTAARFKAILASSRRGVQLSEVELEPFGPTRKHVTVALCPDRVCHTVTTLPDDLIHYCEPRILTVREMARIQSFPDWFRFRGKFTTGGPERKRQAPRYTQVGNAVAPLVSEAIGLALKEYLNMAFGRQPACGPASGVADAA